MVDFRSVELDEEIDPNISGQSNDHGHKDHQGANNRKKGVLERGPDNQKRNHKSSHGKSNPNGITHIHGPVEK